MNHVDSNNINTDLNHTNLIPDDLPKIEPNNNLDKFCSLQQIFSWDSMVEEASTFSMIKILVHTYVSLVHTPSPLHSCPPVPTPSHIPIFTYLTRDPPPPSHDITSLTASATPNLLENKRNIV